MASYLFQGNPDRFDIDGYLQSALEQDREISWSVKQHKNKIQAGDTVFLWRSAGSQANVSGVVAQALCVSDVEFVVPDPFATSYWNDPPSKESRVRLELQAVNVKSKKIIKKDWIANDPELSGLSILRQAQGTNFLIDEKQSIRLENLIKKTGVDWTRAESLAVLYIYKQLEGKEVSKLSGSPVADTALRIGRAVTGVYNKFMDFRSIDPRDDRKGFDSTNAIDRVVWDTYFDQHIEELDAELLQTDFTAVWGKADILSNHNVGSEPLPPEAANDDAESNTSSPRKARPGQAAFKRRLMKLYDGNCAITGVGVEKVLIAAHIVDHALTGNNHSSNGLLLRSDLHSLFDSGLLVIDPDTLEVNISETIKDSLYYRDYQSCKLRERTDGSKPSADQLRIKNRTSG